MQFVMLYARQHKRHLYVRNVQQRAATYMENVCHLLYI